MAPRIYFRTSLTCPHCGTLNDGKKIDLSSTIGSNGEWDFVEVGEAFELTVDDLTDGFLELSPVEGNRLLAIEFFVCSSCRLYAPAMLEFRVRTPHVLELVNARVVPALTKSVLDEANFVTRRIEEWTPDAGEDVARIEELKRLL